MLFRLMRPGRVQALGSFFGLWGIGLQMRSEVLLASQMGSHALPNNCSKRQAVTAFWSLGSLSGLVHQRCLLAVSQCWFFSAHSCMVFFKKAVFNPSYQPCCHTPERTVSWPISSRPDLSSVPGIDTEIRNRTCSGLTAIHHVLIMERGRIRAEYGFMQGLLWP